MKLLGWQSAVKTLSDEEIDKLIMATMDGSPAYSVTEAEILAVVRWANAVRLGAILMEMVLAGQVRVTVENGGAGAGGE